MPPRFPLSEMDDQSAKDSIQKALNAMYGGDPPFKWIEDNGESLMGCYGPLSFSPKMTQKFFEMAKAAFDPTVVKPRNRELAVLALTSVLNVPYVVYCHRGVADTVGLTPEQCQDAVAGKTPQGLTDEEVAAYRLGRMLTTLSQPLDGPEWQDVASKLDKKEIVGIAHTIGGYRWIALLEYLNGPMQVPQGGGTH